MSASVTPASIDRSFQYSDKQVCLNFIQHSNYDVLVFSELGKIGEIVEVIFPEELIGEKLAGHGQVEFESRTLLGSTSLEADLFVKRAVISLAAQNRRRRLLVCLGFDDLTSDCMHEAINRIDRLFKRLCRYLSQANETVSNCAEVKEKKKKNIFLPKTSFVNHIKSHDRAALDEQLASVGQFSDLYKWQFENRKDKPIFELLDGPPYANGPAHTGHAVNKILKDFIVKSQIAAGKRVLYRPGWDCHGLPIELKITQNTKTSEPIEIRRLAREVAVNSIARQMNSFKRWGVSGDWERPYLTMSPEYVSEQLKLFGQMLHQGLIYRAFRPVYWSPSAQTALAESELEYNEKHESTACYFRFKLIDIDAASLGVSLPRQSVVYALTWTSTPWTLPLNNAICVAPHFKYTVIQFNDNINDPLSEVYLIASTLLNETVQKIGRPCTVLGDVDGEQLIGKHYRSCWYNELAQPILSGDHVTATVGTGIVHTAYAHGMQDYTVALSRGEKVESFVDERGCYTRDMGHDLEGKFVLGDGQKTAMKVLHKDIVHTHKYIHSYPYDWRTKKPVLLRSSAQWFIDVGEVGKRAVDHVHNINVVAGDSDQSSALCSVVSTRPSWCISRQRVWGTPIPALKDLNGNVYTSRQLCESLSRLIAEKGCDVWWTDCLDELLTPQVTLSLNLPASVEPSSLRQTSEVMDVWLDSGLAWHCARNDNPETGSEGGVDAVLEGVDQFRGWFQSMLLTSTALRNSAPFKKVYVHGFCVDDNNQKMSKSLGNVVDPDTVTDGSLRQKALGADGLRLWVALQGAESAGESRIGPAVLQGVDKQLVGLRNCLRFLLGALDGYDGQRPRSLPVLDQWVLRECLAFNSRCRLLYSESRFRAVANELIQFTQRTVSNGYINYVRDRLYCAAPGSDEHIAAQFTIDQCLKLLTDSFAVILPHLAVEVNMNQPSGKAQQVLRDTALPQVEATLENLCMEKKLDLLMCLIVNLRTSITSQAGPKDDISKKAVIIHAPEADLKLLNIAQSEVSSHDSQLCELLAVSQVDVAPGNNLSVQLKSPDSLHCGRCRRLSRREGQQHCDRCTKALEYYHA